MNQLNLNGKLFPKDHPVLPIHNRAFHYGDGLFESVRVFDGQIPFLPIHLNRLHAGMRCLEMEGIERFDRDFVQNEIYKLLPTSANARIRLNVFRSGSGLYTPDSNQAAFLIEAQALENASFQLNSTGLSIDLCKTVRLTYDQFSSLKTCNALPYILASKYKKDHQLDDCILLNSSGRIAECSSSNIFLIKNKELWTPPLEEACLDGTCRKLILQIASNHNFAIREIPLSLNRLEIADEIWLSNAISGIRWVAKYRQHTYCNNWAKSFVESLQQLTKSDKNQ